MPRGRPAKKAKPEEEPPNEKEAVSDVDQNEKVAPNRGRGKPPKDKTNLGAEKEDQEEVGEEPKKESLADVDGNTKAAPKRGKGRLPKDKADTNLGAENEEQNGVGEEQKKAALADVDENTKVAPKRGRGRPPKDKTGAENKEQKELEDKPVVKKSKKKPQESRKVSKITIEFCKS